MLQASQSSDSRHCLSLPFWVFNTSCQLFSFHLYHELLDGKDLVSPFHLLKAPTAELEEERGFGNTP